MFADLIGMKADIEHLKSAFGNALKIGSVDVIDAARGYRLNLGEGADGRKFLSPWLPHPETGKTSVPLKKGQIVGVISPSGDLRQGLLFRGGYSDGHPSPNGDMAGNVFEDAGVRLSVVDGKLTIAAGGVVFDLSATGISITGGRVEHDGLNIGSDHVHGGVVRGDVDSFIPKT